MPDIEDLSEDPEEAAAQAFARSEAHTFNGQPLKPLTFARDAAASRLCLTYDSWSDSLHLIFLCLTPEDEVRGLHGRFALDRWRQKAEKWAEGLNITGASPLAREADAVAAAILADKYAADFAVTSKEHLPASQKK